MEVLLNELLKNAKALILENGKISSVENNYNIFSVLNLTNREIYHSRFLADLLNPKGLHKKNDLFLKKFLEIICCEITKNCKLEETIVITEEVTTNGNLDISLKNNNFYIIIENKVWAGDQDAQLYRYSKTKFNDMKPILVYLTPHGTEPSENSLGFLKKDDIIKISYKDMISKWIEECCNIIKDNENIYHILKQYIETIKFKKDDMMEIDIGHKQIEEYLLLQKSLNQSIENKRKKLLVEFFIKLTEKLDEKYSHPFRTESDSISIYFKNEGISYGVGLDAKGLYIGYYKDKPDYSTKEWEELVNKNINFNNKKVRYVYLDYELTSSNEYFKYFIDPKNIEEKVNNIIKEIERILN